uniref:HSF-type DNA-binding domain-containing protein n=2 Tax=Heterosigma akashiwo TaxID=2829 RepID=A0A7S3XKP0_HETAK
MKHFRHDKFPSFQRQLNLYGFRKITRGPYTGAYAHQYFRRGKPEMLDMVLRKSQTPTKSPVATDAINQTKRFNFDQVVSNVSANELSRRVALPHFNGLNPGYMRHENGGIPSLSPLSLGGYSNPQAKIGEGQQTNISPIMPKEQALGGAAYPNPFMGWNGLNLKLERSTFPIGHTPADMNPLSMPLNSSLYMGTLDSSSSSQASLQQGLPAGGAANMGLEALHPDYLKALISAQQAAQASMMFPGMDPSVISMGLPDHSETAAMMGLGGEMAGQMRDASLIGQGGQPHFFMPSDPKVNFPFPSLSSSAGLYPGNGADGLKYIDDPIKSMPKMAKSEPQNSMTAPANLVNSVSSGSSDLALFGSIAELDGIISDQKQKSEVGKKIFRDTLIRSSSKDWGTLIDSQFPAGEEDEVVVPDNSTPTAEGLTTTEPNLLPIPAGTATAAI